MAELGVIESGNAAFRHIAAMLVDGFYFRWKDVYATTHDHVLDAPRYGHQPVLVNASHITRSVPSIIEVEDDRAIFLQHAFHHRCALAHDLSRDGVGLGGRILYAESDG